MKKLLLTLGTISAIALPIATVISCNSSDKKEEAPNTDSNPDMSLIKPITPKVGESGKDASTGTIKPEEHKDVPEVVDNTYHQKHFDDEYYESSENLHKELRNYAFDFFEKKGEKYFSKNEDWDGTNHFEGELVRYRFGDDLIIMNYHELFDYAHNQEFSDYHITDVNHLTDSQKEHMRQFQWLYNKHHDPAQ